MTISIHTLPEPGKGTILALRPWNTLLLLAVLGGNYKNRARLTNTQDWQKDFQTARITRL